MNAPTTSAGAPAAPVLLRGAINDFAAEGDKTSYTDQSHEFQLGGQLADYKNRRGDWKIVDNYDARGRELHRTLRPATMP